jgi:penicillin amidase
MEFWRRLGAGRLSELFGETTLETDKFLRTLSVAEAARQSWEAMDADVRRCLEAYSAGVNAYVLNRPSYRLGLEFTLLALQGVKVEIEPWTPVHSITWGNMMAYDLGANYTTERSALRILRSMGRKGWADYYSPYRGDMPFTIDPGELAAARARVAGGGAGSGAGAGAGAPLFASGFSGSGSNNWVVAGSRTASGKPLLANDMHLGIQMPSIWYEIGLHGMDEEGRGGPHAGLSLRPAGILLPRGALRHRRAQRPDRLGPHQPGRRRPGPLHRAP